MNPKPLETSNHLMTPLSSITLTAASSAISPADSGPVAYPAPGPLGPIPSDAMTPHDRRFVAPLTDASANLVCCQDNTDPGASKRKTRGSGEVFRNCPQSATPVAQSTRRSAPIDAFRPCGARQSAANGPNALVARPSGIRLPPTRGSCPAGNERLEHGTDVLAHDEVRHVVEFGRLAIDDHQSRAVPLGEHGKPGRRPHHERGTDGEE